MNRRALIGLLVVAVVAGVLFYIFRGSRDDHPKSTASTTSSDPQPVRDVPPGTPDRNAPPTRLAPPERVADPSASDTQYQLEDGTIVRDHRGGGTGPYVRPSLPRREDSPVTAQVTSTVMAAVRPIVIKCMSSVPDSAFGDKPLIETRAVVKIDDKGNLDVLELGPALAGIDEDAAAEGLDCIRNAASSIHVQVENPAVASATLAFAIRPRRAP
jgi:hypothetical protein